MKNILFLLALLASQAISFAQTPTDKQLQAIEKYMAPVRKKVTDILEADKTGQYKTYKADLGKIAAEKDQATKNELMTKLERDHLAFIRSAYKKGVVNHEDQRREVARILGHNNFRFGEFADIQIDIILPAAVLPISFDVELTCPMEVRDDSENNSLVADCIARAKDCSMDALSIAETAGGCRSKADVGDKLDLPGNGVYTTIKVTTQTDIHYNGIALALAGYGQTNVKYGIRFRAPGLDKVVITREHMALAPVVWFSRIEGSADNFVSEVSFSGAFNAGISVTAQAHIEAFSLAVPLGSLTWANAFTSNIDTIRIDGSN